MDIAAALDGAKRRDLTFHAGDEVLLALTVYAADGDSIPIDPALVTNPRIVTCPSGLITIPVAAQFTVPDQCCGRIQYRLIAEVSGVTTTLAHGVMTTLMTALVGAGCCWPFGRYDYGGWWGGGWA